MWKKTHETKSWFLHKNTEIKIYDTCINQFDVSYCKTWSKESLGTKDPWSLPGIRIKQRLGNLFWGLMSRAFIRVSVSGGYLMMYVSDSGSQWVTLSCVMSVDLELYISYLGFPFVKESLEWFDGARKESRVSGGDPTTRTRVRRLLDY